jgi:hypothetical protein
VELDIPKPMVHTILTVKLHQQPYKIQVHQMLQEKDHYAQLTFRHQFIEEVGNDILLPDILMFSDEVMFHISGKVNCHN